MAALTALQLPTSPWALLWPLERPETPLPCSGLSGPTAWACSWEGRKGEKQALLPPPRARAKATDPTTPVISSDNGPGACRHRGQQGFQCRAAGEVDGQEDPERQGSSEKREHEKTSGPMGAAGTDGGWGVVVMLSARTARVKMGTHHCLLFP